MDSKTWLAFLTGLVLAGGATYMFTRPSATAPAEPTIIVKTVLPPPAPLDVAPAQVRTQAPPALDPVRAARTSFRRLESPTPAPLPATTPQPAPPSPPAATPAPEPAPQPLPLPAIVPEIALNATGPATKPAPAPVIRSVPDAANTVTIPRGAFVHVRVQETLSSDRNKAGDRFFVTLDEALVADGFVIAERGAHGEGEVVEVQTPGKATGAARLLLALTSVETSDGQTVALRTETIEREGSSPVKSDAIKIGTGAAIGAGVGAAAGGGKGAAIGAAAGSAAGAGAVLLTRAKNVKIPSESKISFRVADAVTITERQ